MLHCVIFSTAPSRAVARKIARALLDGRAVACVNILPTLESHYWWRGRRETAQEVLLIAKTTGGKVAAAMRTLRKMHPYEVPEIIALPIETGLPAYLRWIEKTTGGSGQ